MHVQLKMLGFGLARQQLDDSSKRRAPVKTRSASGGNLDLFQTGLVELAPIDPTAKRVVQRNTIRKHQSAAYTARADATQGDSLSRRVGHQAARSPKETERRHLPQRVVKRYRRGLTQVSLADNDHGSWNSLYGLRCPRGCDRHRLPNGNRMQGHDQRFCRWTHELLYRLEIRMPHAQLCHAGQRGEGELS